MPPSSAAQRSAPRVVSIRPVRIQPRRQCNWLRSQEKTKKTCNATLTSLTRLPRQGKRLQAAKCEKTRYSGKKQPVVGAGKTRWEGESQERSVAVNSPIAIPHSRGAKGLGGGRELVVLDPLLEFGVLVPGASDVRQPAAGSKVAASKNSDAIKGRGRKENRWPVTFEPPC